MQLPAELLKHWLFAQLSHLCLVSTDLSAQPYLGCEALQSFLLAFPQAGGDLLTPQEEHLPLAFQVALGCSHFFFIYTGSVLSIGTTFPRYNFSFISQE